MGSPVHLREERRAGETNLAERFCLKYENIYFRYKSGAFIQIYAMGAR
jgi:hypothetical protein